MSEKYENEVINMNYIIICLRIDENKRLELINGDVYLLHKLSAKAKKKVDEILKKDFGKNYNWNMVEYKTIKIKIE
jgi:F0F1-type ATP synthase delta subunit